MATAKFPVNVVFEAALSIQCEIDDKREYKINKLIEAWYNEKPSFWERVFKATDRRSIPSDEVINILRRGGSCRWDNEVWYAENAYANQYNKAQKIVDLCDAAIRQGVGTVVLTEEDIVTLGGKL